MAQVLLFSPQKTESLYVCRRMHGLLRELMHSGPSHPSACVREGRRLPSRSGWGSRGSESPAAVDARGKMTTGRPIFHMGCSLESGDRVPRRAFPALFSMGTSGALHCKLHWENDLYCTVWLIYFIFLPLEPVRTGCELADPQCGLRIVDLSE